MYDFLGRIICGNVVLYIFIFTLDLNMFIYNNNTPKIGKAVLFKFFFYVEKFQAEYYKSCILTFLIGRLNVSLIFKAGGLRGLLDGVCTEHTFINTIMNKSDPNTIKAAAHQYV